MGRQLIASGLFAARGKASRQQYGRLLVRGGGVPVADALVRTGWDGIKPVATTVITVDPSSGAVRGVRFETKGKLGDIKFKAKDLFVDALPDTTIHIAFDDIGALTWLATGDMRNQSTWADSSSLAVRVFKGEVEIQEEQGKVDAGVKAFAVRFTLLPVAVDKAAIYLGAVPFSKANLSALCEAAGSTMMSPNCPTVAIRLFSRQGKLWNAHPIDLLPVELPEDKLGLGHLPLVEAIGAGLVVFPDADKFEEESVAILRNVSYTNNVSVERLPGLYDKADTFTTAPRAPAVCYEWPEYRGPIVEQAGDAVSVGGGGGLVRPVPTKEPKYSKTVEGGYTMESFREYNLPESIVTVIVEAANLSLAKNTWSSYNTAENHIKRCEADTGVEIRFPMTPRMEFAYFGWLMKYRNVSASTMSQYASGLRVAHLKRGVFPPNLRPDIVKAIITGRENDETLQKKPPRLAMTIDVMKLLKIALKTSNLALPRKRLIWSVSCTSFRGSFRIHELLSRQGSEYDPSCTLMGCDVSLHTTEIEGVKETYLIVNLKNPKEDKLKKGVRVELFRTGSLTCPVDAYTKYRAVSKVAVSKVSPLYRLESGVCYTGNLFNKDIKSLLGRYVNYDEGRFLSHSFRAGYAIV